MLTPQQFREIVSGQRRDLTATAWRAALQAAEPCYWLGISWVNRRFDRDPQRAERVSVPVISVGNLTVGGTGKTPMVEWIAKRLRANNLRVTLISRGYGAEQGAVNDEARELEDKLPDVPHMQNPNRVEAARIAIEELECEVILLDDAFQHRKIHRDLDIVLIDCLQPFGFGHLLPRGLLREPLAGLSRAHAVGLTRADLVSQQQRGDLQQEIVKLAPDAVWFEVAHRPRNLLSASGAETPIDSLTGKRVVAFCGIGNPDGFRQTVQACDCELVELIEFPDHHHYQREDIERIAATVNQKNNIDSVVCTHKDLVKIGVDQLADRPLQAIVIGMEFLVGEQDLDSAILAVCPQG